METNKQASEDFMETDDARERAKREILQRRCAALGSYERPGAAGLTTPVPCVPFVQDFDWRYDENTGEVSSRVCYEGAPWLTHGLLGDVLTDMASGLYLSQAWDPAKLGWKPVTCVVPSASLSLSTISLACGLPRLSPETWRVTAPNPVLHPQFGPCVTRATDGTHVILWSGLSPGSSWLMSHVSNVTGPITSTPSHPSLWAPTAAKRQAKPRKSPPGQTPAESLAEVLALLSALPKKP